MVLAPPAPHAPFEPADRHIDKYNGTRAKRTPNFNVHVNKVLSRKNLTIPTGSFFLSFKV